MSEMIIELLDKMILNHLEKYGHEYPACIILSEINFRILENEIECKYPADIVGRWNKVDYKGIQVIKQENSLIVL